MPFVMATKRNPTSEFDASIPLKRRRVEGQSLPQSDVALSPLPISSSALSPAVFPTSPLVAAPLGVSGATKLPRIPSTSETMELTCSSPSQFLYSPLVASSADVPSAAFLVTSGSAGMDRQPICSTEARSKGTASAKNNKSRIVKSFRNRLSSMKSMYDSLLKEVFFLENGGNLMDFLIWKRKPNILRDQFLKQHQLESSYDTPKEASVDDDRKQGLPSATTIKIPLSTVSSTLHVTPPKGSSPLSPAGSIAFPSSSPRPATRAHTSFSSVYENSHEDIVTRARHEAEVMKAISELRKDGLWGASRLPKVKEPTRVKTHWDYLLEEMQWLATDFVNEKRWKINTARKVSGW